MNPQTLVIRDGLVRSARRRANPLRLGLATAVLVIVVHAVAGNFANEWEGWQTALSNAAVAAVLGAVGVGLTFGILVPAGLRSSADGRNRPARAALLVGVGGILCYVIFFTGAPAIVGAGAMTLGLQGLRQAQDGMGRRRTAVAGLILGAANVAFALAYYLAETASGIGEHWL